MKTKKHSLTILLLVAFLLGACGTPATPPPVPQPTAIPPTETPLPSPTPMPYDLTVIVMDETGNPIMGAEVANLASGTPLPTGTDSTGRASWKNLPQRTGNLTVSAQGYSTVEESLELIPGPNEMTVTLARVPFGMIASEACGPGESLLYAEDFQDSQVNNWIAYPSGTPQKIVADTVTPGDLILALDFGNVDGQFTIKIGPFQSNVVRRLWYRPGDHSRFHLGWNTQDSLEANMSADQFILNDWARGAAAAVQLGKGKPVMLQGVWHLMEISVIGNSVEIWVDGTLNLSAESPVVTSGSDFYFGSALLPPDSIAYFNNISICELVSGSFTSIYPGQ